MLRLWLLMHSLSDKPHGDALPICGSGSEGKP